MSDSLGQEPMIIDSTGTKRAAGERVRIREIHWDAATTAGHTAVVTDINDVVKWKHTVAAANNNIQEDFKGLAQGGLVLNGLKVATLGSGVLYIYCQ
jgi:hypothetical protein